MHQRASDGSLLVLNKCPNFNNAAEVSETHSDIFAASEFGGARPGMRTQKCESASLRQVFALSPALRTSSAVTSCPANFPRPTRARERVRDSAATIFPRVRVESTFWESVIQGKIHTVRK
jgi:hypothetical protein